MRLDHVFCSAALLGLVACAGAPTQPTVAASADTASPAPASPDALQGASSDVLTSGRVDADEVRRLARRGVRHVIDLTHDSETPDFDEAAAVRAAGMRYDNLPIRGPEDLTPENVHAFDRLIAASSRPLLVHCASRNRVGAMAALRAAWVEGKSAEEALEQGRRWGMTSLEGAVTERLVAGR